jgi:hypothetical protein
MFLDAKLHLVSKYVICTLDGVEISGLCYAASEEKGIALCFRTNEEGRKYVEGGKIARELKRGKVVIGLRNDAPEAIRKYFEYRRANQ